ncbi:cold-shock protein [Parendozoicomonas haliclonae]|uniref:Major cold shock protein CspA n=1 Tax=Parendozoicomonas haliclonae TaxID=1960125 RepID=A0A1X7APF8_9GAMM|nr:Major cold shock protein CspA [Parendozoicomonas haliclonae]
MFLSTLKFLQFITGLILTVLFFAAPSITQSLYPNVSPVASASEFYTDSALLIMLTGAFANLLSGCYLATLPPPRKPLQVLASLAFLAAGILAAANAFARLHVDPVLANTPLVTLGLLISGLVLHFICNLHLLNPANSNAAKSAPVAALESGREGGIVKWFNVSKGFGFITRDSGEDIFVHYRAIRGEGHRTLSDGQRVHFVVAKKEKGLQAEDVAVER